jgi:acetyl-CoA decarbonylase/synthase complex subunit beta
VPEKRPAFTGSEFDLPLCEAVYGHVPDPQRVSADLRMADPEDVGEFALHAALAAEMYEATAPDSDELFVGDPALRGMVFSGGKWRAGWAFLLGDEAAGLKPALEEREFMVFESSGRDSHPVYWMQMMVRYAMTWGQIPPGEDHEMSHMIEDDLPGVLVVRGRTTDLEALMALAMMKLGCPAVVPEDFPYEQGRQARIDDPAEVLAAIDRLPNLRVREVDGRRVDLPDYCDPSYAREDFSAERTLGGEGGFLLLRPADVSGGIEVAGEPGEALGILIEVGDERLDASLSEYLERTAENVVGYMPGHRVVSRDPLRLGLAAGTELQPRRLAEVLRRGLLWHFPRLRRVRVRLIFGEEQLRRLRPEVEAFEAKRSRAQQVRCEQSVDEFVACIECQSFSHSHVCVITPDRPPMCGRSAGQVRAAALFGASWHPYKRRGLEGTELREMVPKGECLDAERGEYRGVNEAAARLSDGQIQRVFLHSLSGFPHSSCGCFHNLAFRIEGCGFGVMHRGFEGRAPNGETWDALANRAGGKQADGVTGIATEYLRSPRFLSGEGGLAALTWCTQKVLDEIRDALPSGHRPVTEADVRGMDELRDFVERHG